MACPECDRMRVMIRCTRARCDASKPGTKQAISTASSFPLDLTYLPSMRGKVLSRHNRLTYLQRVECNYLHDLL